MTGHDAGRLVAFLAGDLSPGDAEAVDTHLLECQPCWRAVYEDTLGRTAAESLRELTPAVVRDRLRVAVSLAATHHRTRRSWRRPASTVALLALVAMLTLSVAVASITHASHKPADSFSLIVREVNAATARHGVPVSLVVGGRHLRVDEYDLGAGRVVVAYGTQPFPMPRDAQAATAQINAPWSVSIGGMHVLCINEPRPALLVGDGAVTASTLTAFARQLALV